MKKLHHKNLQRQIANLIPIIELCIALTEQMEQTQHKLNFLPNELQNLKKQAEILKLESSKINLNSAPNFNLESQVKETEFKLDFLVDDLEVIFISLVTFNRQLKNIVALQERLEAVQQERINGLTPERIYKLLKKQEQRSPQKFNSDSQKITSNNPFQRLGQKINICRNPRKLAISIALTAVSILSLSTVYYTFLQPRLIENNTIEQSQKVNYFSNQS